MNSFVKRNTMLVAVLIGSGVVAAGLLIVAGLVWIGLLQRMSATENARSKVVALTKARPAPGAENERRIQHDIDIFKKAAGELRAYFASPLKPAVDEFIKELQPPRADRITDEQHERLRVHRENEADMTQEEIRKLPVAKLTQETFKELFRETFESDPANSDEIQRRTLATQNFFIPGFRRKFPNWTAALAKFVEKAKTITGEPIGQTNDVALLLYAIGFPRAIPNAQEFARHMENYRNVLVQKAETLKLEMMPQAANFMLGNNASSTDTAVGVGYAAADIREIFFQWDVLSDIVNVLGSAGMRTFHNIQARNFAEAPEEGRKLGNYSETIGSYKFYHYTIEVAGSLKSIRDFCAKLDNSYLRGRPYVVRAVTLYAEENGAAILMGQGKKEAQNENNSNNDNEFGGGRRRRQAVAQNSDKDQQIDPEELRAREEARIKALPMHQRPGYGAVVVGAGESYRAMIDVDYVVLEQNQ